MVKNWWIWGNSCSKLLWCLFCLFPFFVFSAGWPFHRVMKSSEINTTPLGYLYIYIFIHILVPILVFGWSPLHTMKHCLWSLKLRAFGCLLKPIVWALATLKGQQAGYQETEHLRLQVVYLRAGSISAFTTGRQTREIYTAPRGWFTTFDEGPQEVDKNGHWYRSASATLKCWCWQMLLLESIC